jgi:hypothetical protein
MRTIALFLIVTFFNLSLSAQDTWNDYVIGRPMANYYEAKKTIAKAWGINYQPTFAGCILSDETSEKSNAYQKSNKIYFKALASKYGKNWMQEFELDVKKEMHRNSNSEKGTWYEIVENSKGKAFYASKKIVAKTWGISYEAKFVSEDMSATEKETLMELFLANNDYVDQLENTFGQDWQKTLNKEVDFELAKKVVTEPKNVWIDYVVGKPYMAYFDAKKAIAKEWGINYEVQFKGCSLSEKMEAESAAVDAANLPYLKLLEKQHGKDWNTRFEKAVKERIEKNRLSEK